MQSAPNNGTYEVSTNEIMDFLKEHMVTKADLKEILKDYATKEDMGKMRSDIIDFVDNKITDIKGDMIAIVRKEDRKLIKLIEILLQNQTISQKDASTVFGMEPFPQGV